MEKNDMIKIAILISALLLIKLGGYESQIKTDDLRLDTLYHPDFGASVVDRQCVRFVDGYKLKFGILISNYYTIMDSLRLNLNDDGLVDNVLVLSPKSLDAIETPCRFSFDTNPKRILVEVINDGNGAAKIRGVYYNVLSDTGGVLSHFSGIFHTNNGFKIVHEAGANYSWSYSTEFSVTKKRLGLKQISKICAFGDKADSLNYQYDNIDLGKVNIPDTLANQCNCDILWSKLDK
ncbi:hypothetical protein [Dyadobacter sp. BHUBP1]|uniref:hypothetical protein n=1 Tax=Dyadobacter sp. BHUBP1 TaxID=3424178 RepID=UPI003D32CFE1